MRERRGHEGGAAVQGCDARGEGRRGVAAGGGGEGFERGGAGEGVRVVVAVVPEGSGATARWEKGVREHWCWS